MTEVESSMNFFDHIKELRQKLIYVIIFFIIAFIVSFYFSQSIFEFLAKPLTSILDNTLRTREDKVVDGGIRDKILENSPNKNEEFFIVPKVID